MRKFVVLTAAALGSVAFAGTNTATQTVTFSITDIRVINVTGTPSFSFGDVDFTAGQSVSATKTAAGVLLYSTNAASRVTAGVTNLPNWVDSFTVKYGAGTAQSLKGASAILNVNAGAFSNNTALEYGAAANLLTPVAPAGPTTVTYTITAVPTP